MKKRQKYSSRCTSKLRPYCHSAHRHNSRVVSFHCYGNEVSNDLSETMLSSETKRAALCCFGAAFLIYINTIYADFAYDDNRAIVKNQDLRPETDLSSVWLNDFWGTPLNHTGSHKSYRPLTVLTFRFNYALHGLNPGGYHFVNVLLHSVTTGLYTLLVAAVVKHTFTVWLAGLLFAIHPIHTEAVAGLVGRADVLCGLFFILTLLAYTQYCSERALNSKTRFFWLFLSLLLTTCATLSKELGITVLAICILLDVLKISHITVTDIQHSNKTKMYAILEGFITLLIYGVALLFLRLYFMGFEAPVFSPADNPAADSPSLLTRTLTFLYLPLFNFLLLIYPAVLSFDWSMNAIPLLESVTDHRLPYLALFYISTLWCIKYSLQGVFGFLPNEQSDQKQMKTFNGEVSEYSPASYQSMHHTSNISHLVRRHCRRDSTSSSDSAVSEDICNNNVPAYSSRPTKHYSTVLLGLGILIVTFIPASNLFFYVGFVVAERVLYIPSMGFCLLVGEIIYRMYKYLKDQHAARACLILVLTFAASLLTLRTYTRCLDWRSEEALYKSGIHVNPAKAWGNLANILKNQGNNADAEAAYRKALNHRGNMADVHYNLGVLLQDQKRYKEALQEYDWAIEFRPRLTVAHLNKGIVLALLGQHQQAIKVYKDCAEIDTAGLKDPRMHESAKISALYNMGRLYAELNDFKSAIDSYTKALSRRPEHYSPHSIYNLLGEAYYQSGNFSEAEISYRRSLEARPDHVPAHLTMAKLLTRMKRINEAEKWYLKALKLNNEDVSVCQHYAMFLGDVGRHDEALAQWKRSESLDSGNFDIIFSIATTYRQLQDYDMAEKYYMKATIISPGSSTAHMNLGAIYHLNKNYGAAEKSYLRALEIDPNDLTAQNNLKKLRNITAKKMQNSS